MSIARVTPPNAHQQSEEINRSTMKAHEDVQTSNSSQAANNANQSSTVHHSQQDPDLKTQSAQSGSQQNTASASDQAVAAQKAERALESPGKRIDVLG